MGGGYHQQQGTQCSSPPLIFEKESVVTGSSVSIDECVDDSTPRRSLTALSSQSQQMPCSAIYETIFVSISGERSVRYIWATWMITMDIKSDYKEKIPVVVEFTSVTLNL